MMPHIVLAAIADSRADRDHGETGARAAIASSGPSLKTHDRCGRPRSRAPRRARGQQLRRDSSPHRC